MKAKNYKVLSRIMVLCLLFSFLGNNVKAATQDATVKKVSLGAKNTIEIDDVKVTYSVLISTKSFCSLGVTIENIGDEDICDWAAMIPLAVDVSSVLGAEIMSTTEDSLILKHSSLNAVIKPRKSVFLTINIKGCIEMLPDSFILIKGYNESINSLSYNLDITHIWNGFFFGTLEVENNGGDIEGKPTSYC